MNQTNPIDRELRKLHQKALQFEQDPSIDFLSVLSNHSELLAEYNIPLIKKFTPEAWLSFITPLERLLQRSVADHDFLARNDLETAQANPLILVLDNLRSAFNVGSLIRSVSHFNGCEIILVGYTPTPDNPLVRKTALGANLPWKSFPRLAQAIEFLKERNYQVYALEKNPLAKNIFDSHPPEKTAYLLGNEKFGLSQELESCDFVYIPGEGYKHSLNVAVAGGVACSYYCQTHG